MRNVAWFSVLLTLIVGCHRGAPPTAELAPGPLDEDAAAVGDSMFPQGLFFYEAQAANQKLTGRIIIADNLVQLDPDDDECWRMPTRETRRQQKDFVVFGCKGAPAPSGRNSVMGNTQIVVDLRWPTRRSRWGRLSGAGGSPTCANTSLTPQGRQYCSRYSSGGQPAWTWGTLKVSRGSLATLDSTTRRPPPEEAGR